ncbi:glycosyltransferase (plasmid) [Streptomyces sp. C1-1]|uniref:glycosyltransferase n=1 Tax=Streptomyces sp. C1-1 TaxID=3231173 RepID=UPI003D06C069
MDEFVFLSVFTWQLRKGWDILLRAYFEEFSEKDGVSLMLRCDPFRYGGGNLDDSIRRDIEESRRKFGGENPPALKLLTDHIGNRELVDLYASSDAFVLPSRGEGWSRPVMEAMALGVPVITTGWGGQTEFAEAESVRLLEYNIVPVSRAAEREYGLFAGHRWAEPSLAHLRREMRAALNLGKGFRDRQSAAKILASFDHLRIAEDILDLLAFPAG